MQSKTWLDSFSIVVTLNLPTSNYQHNTLLHKLQWKDNKKPKYQEILKNRDYINTENNTTLKIDQLVYKRNGHIIGKE